MSGNPVPQHNPTDGLGVAAKVNITSDGQGGSALTTIVADREYSMTLSLSGASGYNSSVRLTAAAQDVNGGLYFPQQNFFVRNPNNPASGSPAWYRPSNFAGYAPDVFSAAASGTNNNTILVTALALGHGTLEVDFPTFDNTEAGSFPEDVYAQVNITVIP